MNFPNIVTREEWLKARKALLAREKEFTRQHYALADALRKLPMVKIEKDYPFDAPKGTLPSAMDYRQHHGVLGDVLALIITPVVD